MTTPCGMTPRSIRSTAGIFGPECAKPWVRVEERLDGTIAVRFQERYVRVRRCAPPLRELASPKATEAKPRANRQAQTQKRLDEELLCPVGTALRKAVEDPMLALSTVAAPKANGAPGKTGPAIFALYYIRRPLLGGFTKADLVHKNQNPQNGQLMARFDWGFGAICFGASPVAAVFGSAPGSATPPEHRIHLSPTSPGRLLKTGHFYFAGNRTFLLCLEPQSDDIETVEQILAKAFTFDFADQVAMRRRDHADFHFARRERPHGPELPLLQQAQQFHLRFERQIANLIEECCTAVRQFDQSPFGFRCPGKGAAHVSEQLRPIYQWCC